MGAALEMQKIEFREARLTQLRTKSLFCSSSPRIFNGWKSLGIGFPSG